MSVRLKAIFRNGVFLPITNGEKINVAENAEVELTVHNPYILPATATNDEAREQAWLELLESWSQHQLSPEAPRLTRDDLHERR